MLLTCEFRFEQPLGSPKTKQRFSCSVVVNFEEMNSATQVQTLTESAYALFCANDLYKGMFPYLVMGKVVGQTLFYRLG